MPLESKHYIMKSLTDADIIKGSSGQVYTSKDYNLVGVNNLANRRDFVRNRFEIGGLYDIRIFGLVDYCKCMSTRVFSDQAPKKCPVCGITVFGSEDAQSKAYGHFVMPYATTTPVKIARLRTLFKEHGWSISNGMGTLSEYNTLKFICMSGYNSENGKYELTDDTPADEIGLDGLYKMGGFETCVNRVLVIPSTCYRTCYPKRDKRTGSIVLNMAGDTRMGTQLSAILSFTQFMQDRMPSNLSVVELATIKFNYVWLLYNYFRQSPILAGGKFHSVRDLTRSTIESSIRATIAPCLDLELNKIRVPAGLAYHALDESIKDKLIEQGYTAANAIKEIKDHTELAQKTFEDILNNETVCLLWRNPTLYKNSVSVVYPELWKNQDSPAIGIPVELCTPMNADFDGDQVGKKFC